MLILLIAWVANVMQLQTDPFLHSHQTCHVFFMPLSERKFEITQTSTLLDFFHSFPTQKFHPSAGDN